MPFTNGRLIEQVAKFLAFGAEVAGVVFAGLHLNGDTFDDLEAVSVQADHFAGVVGQETDLSHAEIVENLGTDAEVP